MGVMRHVAVPVAIFLGQAARGWAMCATVDSTSFVGGAAAGVPCEFPFSYLGVSYTECITEDASQGPWCAVSGWGTPGAVGWGFCNSSCPVRSTTTPGSTVDESATGSSSTKSSATLSDEAIIALCVGTICLFGAIVVALRIRASRKSPAGQGPADKKDAHNTRLHGPHATYDYAEGGSDGTGSQAGHAVPHPADLYDNIANGIPVEEDDISEMNDKPRQIRSPADIIDQLDRNLLPAMSGPVQIMSELEAGAEVHRYRRVNEQARGELAGQQTRVGADARYIATEVEAQRRAHTVKRVNEQVRGELAGNHTNVGADSAQISTEIEAQKQAFSVKRVNEQVRGELAGHHTHVKADSAQISREIRAQNEVSSYRRVNEQARGELAGMKTAVDAHSRSIVDSKNMQRQTSQVRRVSEQVRGELAGKQTRVDHQAIGIVANRKSQELSHEVMRVKAGITGHVARDGKADARHNIETIPEKEAASALCAERPLMSPETREKFMALMKGPAPASKMEKKRTSLI